MTHTSSGDPSAMNRLQSFIMVDIRVLLEQDASRGNTGNRTTPGHAVPYKLRLPADTWHRHDWLANTVNG